MRDSRAALAGEQFADLDLLDEMNRPVALSALAGPLLILVLRSPGDAAGLRMLRDFRDQTLAFRKQGVALCAVAQAEPSTLAFLRSERGLGFPLLADPQGAALERWSMIDCNGLLLLDRNLRLLQRAQAERATAEAMLKFVRRGGARGRRLGEKMFSLLHSVQHLLWPRRLVR